VTERGPVRLICICGRFFTDITENEAYAQLYAHVAEMAQEDDLLHGRKTVEKVESTMADGPALKPQERLHAMSDDVAQQLTRRNFGDEWTAQQETDLMKQMLIFVVDQTHSVYHTESYDSTDRWQDCRRLSCTYVAMALDEGKDVSAASD
jgi:hypothetical protein